MAREYKTVAGLVTGVDEDQGIIKAIFAVMGNIDLGNDRIHNGAFTKTFVESGRNVLVLDQHRTDSINRTIAKPIAFREIPLEELPEDLLMRFPAATAGAEITAQFDPQNDEESKKAFFRLKNDWVTQWSFGYDPLDYDFTDEVVDGEKVSIRNLRTIKLYEVSPVLWGMNPATTTTEAKADGKPWNVFEEEGEFCVYRVDEDGNKVGDEVGCHGTAEEARQQVEALYANVEEDDADLDVDDKLETEPYSKATNLSQLVANVRAAFNAEFNPEDSWDYWACAVYDEFVVVESQEEKVGIKYHAVEYAIGEDEKITFDPKGTWTEGDLVFVPKGEKGSVASSSEIEIPEVEDIGKSLPMTLNINVGQNEEFARKLDELQELVESLVPTPIIQAVEDKKRAGPEHTPPTSEQLAELEKEILELQQTMEEIGG